MSSEVERLNAQKVARLSVPGLYPDGAGLYLQITARGRNKLPTKSWVYRFMLCGHAREMGLGPVRSVTLAKARVRAADARRLRDDGVDPIEARKVARQRAALEAAKSVTFREYAGRHVAEHRTAWRNAKHVVQWETTLETYAYPIIGPLPVQQIDTNLVLKVLQQDQDGKPLWIAKPETAGRLRGRIEAILDGAKARGIRAGENPARWRGHLDQLLPKRSKVRKVRHHPALPYDALPAFMAKLRAQPGIDARALEYTILTVARTNETIGGRRREIAERIWLVSAERMKADRDHRVPLSKAALELIGDDGDPESYIFSARPGKPLSNMTMDALIRRMYELDPPGCCDAQGRKITVHGFRSTFRDWAAERTGYPNHVVEMALAHAIADKTEAAYRRGELFEKRRRLMDDWAKFCSSKPAQRGEFVAMNAAR